MAPDSPSRINQIARQVFDAVVEDRMQEPAKFAAGVDRCVDPNRVWAAIQPNAALFSHEVSFDGGFVLPALINSGWSAGDFCRAFSPKFSDSVRKIRNALVHAREARQVGIIAPTHENYEKLAPWLPPLQIAAMDAMMFGADT